MGGGDLNFKKSWHPQLLKNQEAVYLKEQKSLKEKQKLEERRREIQEERDRVNLEKLKTEASGKKYVERMDWMYQAPGNSSSGAGEVSENMQSYLLGRRRIDDLIKMDEPKSLSQSTDRFDINTYSKANTARDTQNKIRDDPLLMIKKKEQAEIEEILNNKAKLKALKTAATGVTKSSISSRSHGRSSSRYCRDSSVAHSSRSSFYNHCTSRSRPIPSTYSHSKRDER